MLRKALIYKEKVPETVEKWVSASVGNSTAQVLKNHHRYPQALLLQQRYALAGFQRPILICIYLRASHTPSTVSTMPSKDRPVSVSPNSAQATKAVAGGTR